MKHLPRKAVINYAPNIKKLALGTVHREQRGKLHRHVCTEPTCRLIYEDPCYTPERNGRCRPCKGQRRTWIDREGLSSLDPRECCIDNTQLLTTTDDLARFDCAGPGPWFQCRTCKRVHGHPCTDPDLLARPLTTHQEGTTS